MNPGRLHGTRVGSGVAALLGALSVAVAACNQKHEFEPPDREEQVAEADLRYSQALFDTVDWPSDSVRELQGNITYATTCRKCHGPLGHGGTDLAKQRGLDVPSLVEPDWPFANSLDSVRHRVFIGHQSGMPTFGVSRLTPREIDGASWYVLHGLRHDVLGTGGGG